MIYSKEALVAADAFIQTGAELRRKQIVREVVALWDGYREEVNQARRVLGMPELKVIPREFSDKAPGRSPDRFEMRALPVDENEPPTIVSRSDIAVRFDKTFAKVIAGACLGAKKQHPDNPDRWFAELRNFRFTLLP